MMDGRDDPRHGGDDGRGRLPYEERGQGGPVLLIPGIGFGAGSWEEFGDLLAARRRVIAYERRGFTPAAPEPAEDMRVNADDARSILERADSLPSDIVGWSAWRAGRAGTRRGATRRLPLSLPRFP